MDRIPSQVIGIEKEKYLIPQENLKELVRVSAADVKNKIDKVGNQPVIRLRQEFIPLLDLAAILGVEKTYSGPAGETCDDRRLAIADRRSVQHLPEADGIAAQTGSDRVDRQEKDRRTNPASAVNIAVVSAEDCKYGLVVDQFFDSEEIDILPTGRYLAQAGIYIGTAITGDDSAALILDILNIAHQQGLSMVTGKVNDAVKDSLSGDHPDLESLSLLTFRNSETEHFAVNLDAVERLERIESSKVEKLGKEEVVQYRGGSLPLFTLSKLLDCSETTVSKHQEIIVLRNGKSLVGLKVLPPVDTVEDRFTIDTSAFNTPPVIGSVILKGKTTLLLDAQALVKEMELK